jgi:hypothetical protein
MNYEDALSQGAQVLREMRRQEVQRESDVAEAQIAMPGLLSGEPTWLALIHSVEDLTRVAPQDHDVFLVTDDIFVLKAEFLRPHSFRFEGLNQDGHRTWVIVHFSQLKARVVYLPKRDAASPRIITGFADGRIG